MKKTVLAAAAVCAVLFFACGYQAEPSLSGIWRGNELLEETMEFREDGTGRNENSLSSYDFCYEYNDGRLSLYKESFGEYISGGEEFCVDIAGDVMLLTDDTGNEYVYTRQR